MDLKKQFTKKSKFFLLMAWGILLILLTGCGKNNQDSENNLALKNSQIIVGDLDWQEVTSLLSSNPIRKNSNFVADLDIPQKNSRCTGFLISEDILMTNEHCISSTSDSYQVKAYFKHEQGVDYADWEEYECDEFLGDNEELDYALLKCKNSPGREFGYANLSKESVQVNTSIYVIQQNCDYYFFANCDWTKKYSIGKITDYDQEYSHNADTLGGSSGSPVFSSEGHQVVALHHAGVGNNGYGRGVRNYAVPMSKIYADLENRFPEAISTSSNNGQDNSNTYSPNNTFNNALNIDNNFSAYFELTNPNDVDFFKITINQEQSISISIFFNHNTSDLDLAIYDSNFYELAKSEGTSDSENIAGYIYPGTYYIKVYGFNGDYGVFNLKVD